MVIIFTGSQLAFHERQCTGSKDAHQPKQDYNVHNMMLQRCKNFQSKRRDISENGPVQLYRYFYFHYYFPFPKFVAQQYLVSIQQMHVFGHVNHVYLI